MNELAVLGSMSLSGALLAGAAAPEEDAPSLAPQVLLWAVWGMGAGAALAVRGVSYVRFSQHVLRRARPASREAQRVYGALTAPDRRGVWALMLSDPGGPCGLPGFFVRRREIL